MIYNYTISFFIDAWKLRERNDLFVVRDKASRVIATADEEENGEPSIFGLGSVEDDGPPTGIFALIANHDPSPTFLDQLEAVFPPGTEHVEIDEVGALALFVRREAIRREQTESYIEVGYGAEGVPIYGIEGEGALYYRGGAHGSHDA